jgi:hypothetical protein
VLKALVLVAVFALAGCGQASLIVANRSDAPLAVGPGVTIAACSSTTIAASDFEAARSKGVRMTFDGQNWVPDGARVWDDYILLTKGLGTVTVIVSATAAPQTLLHTVAEPDLPTCGGQPILGPASMPS